MEEGVLYTTHHTQLLVQSLSQEGVVVRLRAMVEIPFLEQLLLMVVDMEDQLLKMVVVVAVGEVREA